MTARAARDPPLQSTRAHTLLALLRNSKHSRLPAAAANDVHEPSPNHMRFRFERQRFMAGAARISSWFFHRLAIARRPACAQALVENLAVLAMAMGYHTVGGSPSMMMVVGLTEYDKF